MSALLCYPYFANYSTFGYSGDVVYEGDDLALALSAMRSMFTFRHRRESRFPAHARVLPTKGLWSSITALFLILCLLTPMSAAGLVLCIGEDGHIALEFARNSRCTTPLAPASPLSPQITPWTSPPDHCGPCVDVPLLTSEDGQQFIVPSPPLLAPDVPVLALAMPLVATPAVPAVPTSAWPSCPTVSPMLTTLRTVVLLL